jgi:hypothetical protein
VALRWVVLSLRDDGARPGKGKGERGRGGGEKGYALEVELRSTETAGANHSFQQRGTI